ncbi:hypothetical protein CI109_105667 [Kwoniella shandongensis]|uniref:Uncharacterized protein n=1 Tax=Kwoniella shandongensis TaxID=1734106 RepID=A0A5M6C4R9_9TREE|nr:uncharacterized protein CI109_003007 [Kwoniella shandongensis]KAA5528475.1 hypothetical protein CI109_003007 [Kwoniella shandongensis]
MSSARRVYETPELMSSIFSFMEKKDQCKLLTLERSFFPSVVEEVWGSVPYDIVKDILDLYNPRGRIYVYAVRDIVITDPELDLNPTIQFALISTLLDDFPNLRTASRKIDYLAHLSSSTWKSTFDNLWSLKVEDGGQWIVVNLRTEWLFESEMDLDELEPPVFVADGMWIEHYIDVVFDAPSSALGIGIGLGGAGVNESQRYIDYLTDFNRRHPRICTLDTSNVGLPLSDLARIISFRHPGHLNITKVRAASVGGFTMVEFESFCRRAGNSELEVLHLDNQRGSGGVPRNLLDFKRMIKAIVEGFPNLISLEIPISITRTTPAYAQGSNFVPVTEIEVLKPDELTVAPLRKLKHFAISVYGQGWGRGGVIDRYAFPVDTMAKTLAVAIAPAPPDEERCRFGINNKTQVFLGYNVSKELDNSVHDFHRLSEYNILSNVNLLAGPPPYTR